MISLRMVFLMCVILERAENFEQNCTSCTLSRACPRSFLCDFAYCRLMFTQQRSDLPVCSVHMGSVNCHFYSCLVPHYNTLSTLSQMLVIPICRYVYLGSHMIFDVDERSLSVS